MAWAFTPGAWLLLCVFVSLTPRGGRGFAPRTALPGRFRHVHAVRNLRTVAFAKTKKKKSGAKSVKTARSSGFGAAPTQSKDDEALASRVKRLKAAKTDPQRWLELAAALAEQGEYAEARQVFEAGLRVCGEEEGAVLSKALGAMKRSKASPEVAARAREVVWPGQDDQEVWTFDAERAASVGFRRYSVPEPPRPCPRGTTHANGEGLVVASTTAVLPPEECDWLVAQIQQAAEDMWMVDAKEENVGADAIYDRPFPDRIWMREVPGLEEWFQHRLRTRLFPMLASLYPHIIPDADCLRSHDCLVARYEAEGMSSLEDHRDSTSFSFTIAWNRADDYDGGGTYFPQIREAGKKEEPFEGAGIKTDIGGVVTFPGQCWHGGNKITRGVRYVSPVFIFLEVNERTRRPRGYFLEELVKVGIIDTAECVW